MDFINDFEEYLNKEFPLPEVLTKPLRFNNILDQSLELLNSEIIPSKSQEEKPKPQQKLVATATNFVLEGSLSAGKNTRYSVHGKDIKTSTNTWIFGDLRLGSRVKAKGVIAGDERICTSIVVFGDH